MRLSRSLIRMLGGIMLLTAVPGCENDPAEVEAMTKPMEEVEEARDITGVFSQTGNIQARLTAPLMLRVRADTPYTEFPENILVHFYKDSLTLESVVSARYAKYFELMGKVYLRDSVVVYNLTGDTLFANDLWWDQNQQVFYTDDSVRIRTLTQKLRGSGLWALADFSRYTIRNPKGDVDLPPEFDPQAPPGQ